MQASTQAATITFRLGLKHGGRLHKLKTGVGSEHLQIIRAIYLVVREDDAELLRIPVPTVVDPGNEIHLLAQFEAQRKMFPKLEMEFEEHLETGSRRVRIPLREFLIEP